MEKQAQRAVRQQLDPLVLLVLLLVLLLAILLRLAMRRGGGARYAGAGMMLTNMAHCRPCNKRVSGASVSAPRHMDWTIIDNVVGMK